MLYGINFNGSQIPDAIARKFAKRLNGNFKAVGSDKGCKWLLVGVATDIIDRDRAISQASNGRRQLHVVERKTAGASFYGIYAG